MIMPAHTSNCSLPFLYIKTSFVCFISLFINLEVNKTLNSPAKLQDKVSCYKLIKPILTLKHSPYAQW